ncbi:MAG TPA: DNA/RNA helicase domain-containing protein [Gemmatimonadaceae bacterium]
MSEARARYGWESAFPEFSSALPREIREALRAFVTDASPEQVRAWADAIPPLQEEVQEVLVRDELARHYSAILEYELPMEARRPDVILLVGAVVMVVELKGKTHPSQADIDQAAAYARDLRSYHRECADRPVVPVLVPTRAHGYQKYMDGVHVAGPDALDALVARLSGEHPEPLVDRARFLAESAYCPLPTLVEAARELFQSGELRVIHRARAATEPAVDEISRIIHQAALTKSRHLILVTGVPGAGKTLVGLRTVHARYLDDLAVPRADGRPTAPAVFLSGNGPLVEVLQYELSGGGGGGKAFVRGVKDYVRRYSSRPEAVPPEHVLVFDEAQRAFDARMMAMKHGAGASKSEPEQFIEFADRIPEWCVVVGLIGSGQEIHVGEEGGIGQWRTAVEGSPRSGEWTVHAPPNLAPSFTGSRIPLERRPTLNLDVELRYHLVSELHSYVDELLTGGSAAVLAERATRLNASGFHLRITRSLEQAKGYLRERYADDRDARFGIVASSKDRHLVDFGIPNDFQSTKRVRMGPWYGEPEDGYSEQSCRLLETCVTEFGSQGLELDATLLAWGTDFRRDGNRWSNALARGYLRKAMVRDPFTLRLNAYRVLLTRGRDGCVAFVPNMPLLDETYEHLLACGWRSLDGAVP